jgi:epoxyqueuosine reductase
MDASRCIAYLTIEKRGSIPTGLRAGIGRNIFGCDICQDVCPWNRRTGERLAEPAATTITELAPREHFVNPELRRLARMSEEEFRSAFRHSPVNRAKYQGLMRNVIVAMGNSGDPSFIPELEAFARSENPVLNEQARWSLGILHSTQKPVKQKFGP